MPSIGGILQDERENQGRTLKEVAAKINIKEEYLAAIEDDAFDDIPGETFVKGFIRNYANFLGLNGSDLVGQYKKYKSPSRPIAVQAAAVSKVQEKKKTEHVSQKKELLPRITYVAGAILFLLLCLWLFI